MQETIGVVKTQQLAKYEGVTSLDRVGAREVLRTVFPDAPEAELARAILLCVNYQLNPLMNHVYLVPFQRRERGQVVGTDWATIVGRGAKRLMASRRGPYSYIDNTPRVMTQQEQLDTFGEYDEDKLWCITKLQDPKTGATAVGYGFWPKTKSVYNKPGEREPNQPKGTDKGNSMFNMGAGRSETQALDRLRPGEMPVNVPVMDEGLAEEALKGDFDSKDYIEGEVVTEVKESSPGSEPTSTDPPEPEQEMVEELFEKKAEVTPGPELEKPQAKSSPDKTDIDPKWLKKSMEALQAKNPIAYSEEAMVSYMESIYKVEGKTIAEIVEKLDGGMSKHFIGVIKDSLSKP